MLTKTQRQYLKGLANTLKPLVQIGKSGLNENIIVSVDEVLEAAEAGELTENLPHVHVCGVMAMASLTDDMEQVAQEFDLVRRTFVTLKDECFDESEYFNELSMGMSDDWQVAVKYGATLVRIGTAIFGPREY